MTALTHLYAAARTSPPWAFLRLEFADALRSRWLVFASLGYLAIFGLFGWLGMRESSVLGFTGVSRIVLNAANAIVLVLPLTALVATSQTVVRARSSGFFELFLSQPCRRSDWFVSALLARLGVLVLPLAATLGAVYAAGALAGEDVGALVGRSLSISAALLWAYAGLGLLISTLAQSSERAIVYSLLVWLLGAALHDFAVIGLLLELHVEPHLVFALTAANPVEAARLGLLSGIDPELSVFGPVGFWIANQLGARLAFAVGLVWPLLVGAGAASLALARLNRSDLVG
jgi:ABC-2 type transport system permease protein